MSRVDPRAASGPRPGRSRKAAATALVEGLPSSARDELRDTLAAARRGEFDGVVADRWAPDLRMTSGQGFQGGMDMAVTGMEADLAYGVRQHFVNAVTSRDFTVWEMAMVSPPHDPPAAVWLMSHRDGRAGRLRLFFP